MRSSLRLAWLALPALVACGSIDDPSQRKPLAVIEGQLTQSQTAPVLQSSQSNVRIAVVWLGIDDRSLKSTQDVKAEPVFPSKFKLALTEPPPESAMVRKDARYGTPDEPPTVPGQPPSGGSGGGSADPDEPPPPPKPAPAMRPQSYKSWPADFGIAVGAVVAYEDLNGNGKLDLVEDDATAYVDRVLGINQDLFLVYTEGSNVPTELRDMNNAGPAMGFNLLHRKVNECRGDDCTGSIEVKWLPIGTLYDLPLTAEPRFGDIMCRGKDGFGGGADSVSETGAYMTPINTPGPNGKYPAPSDPNVTCMPDGQTFSYRTCETIDKGLCKGTTLTCTHENYGWQGTTPPVGWPCPVK